jgi:ribonuclease HI
MAGICATTPAATPHANAKHAHSSTPWLCCMCSYVLQTGTGLCMMVGAHNSVAAVHITIAVSTPKWRLNRAELAAIYAALTINATHIATDSLNSMHQINKMLLRPQDMQENRHYNLLESIRHLILNRDEPTHIYKVPAHTGITGNEHADYIAKLVAKGTLEHQYYLNLTLPSSNTRNKQYWPHHLPINPPTTPQPISSLYQPLQTHIHPYQRLGQANQESIYYQAWHQATPLLHPKYTS